MILSQGEKMVWAAAFVEDINKQRNRYPTTEDVASAVVSSCDVVLLMRTPMPESGSGFRPGEGAMQMLRAMLRDEE